MTIMQNFWFGDWFIMMQLCKKMHPEVFHDLVIDLRNRYAKDFAECKANSYIFARLTDLNSSDFKVYLDYSHLRLDPKHADNMEGNPYPTLPLLEKPQAPYMETP